MKMKNALSSTFFIYIVKILTVNSQEKSTTGTFMGKQITIYQC